MEKNSEKISIEELITDDEEKLLNEKLRKMGDVVQSV